MTTIRDVVKSSDKRGQNPIVDMMETRNGLAFACRNHTDRMLTFFEDFGMLAKEEHRRDMLTILAEVLDTPQAETVFWKDDMWDMALEGSENWIGKSTQFFRIEPDTAHVAVWYFETACHFVPHTIPQWYLVGEWWTDAIIIIRARHSDGGFQLMTFGLVGNYDDVSPDFRIVLFGIQSEEEVNENICGYVAAYEFMNLPFVGRNRPNHDTRKKIKRHGWDYSAVSVISLRREQRTSTEQVSEISSGREYQWQWFRAGHWRRLHEPRKADGVEVTYVRAALCGPDDKPIKDRIVKVVR